MPAAVSLYGGPGIGLFGFSPPGTGALVDELADPPPVEARPMTTAAAAMSTTTPATIETTMAVRRPLGFALIPARDLGLNFAYGAGGLVGSVSWGVEAGSAASSWSSSRVIRSSSA